MADVILPGGFGNIATMPSPLGAEYPGQATRGSGVSVVKVVTETTEPSAGKSTGRSRVTRGPIPPTTFNTAAEVKYAPGNSWVEAYAAL